MKISYEINGEVFTTRRSVEERVKYILYSYGKGGILNRQDAEFMLDLFTYHASYTQKAGVGIHHVSIRKNPPYGTMGFWIIRTDGTETDISYLECLRGSSKRKEFERACRAAVHPYILAFKQDFFDHLCGDSCYCPYTGEGIDYDTAHVDHRRPRTFRAILDSFIAHEGLDVDKVEVLGKGLDGVMGNTLADEELEQRWITYHNQYADLQIVSRTANLSLLKRGE